MKTLEESTTEKVPQELQDIVERLFNQNTSPDTLQRDLFFVLLLVSMLENNFVIIENEVEINNAVVYVDLEQLRKWKSAVGVYECKFVLREFQTLPLKLIVSPLGAMVVVNIIIEELNRETYSVCLPVSKYVVSPHASTVPMIFRDLNNFSITFKNTVLTPVKSRILSHYGFPSASLSGLPEDVLYNILLHLPITDIINTRKTCKTLHCMMDNEDLWHKLYRRDFNNTAELSDTNSTWLDLYKKEYQLKCEALLRELRHRTAGTLHDYMDHSDFMSYIENPMWDMIM